MAKWVASKNMVIEPGDYVVRLKKHFLNRLNMILGTRNLSCFDNTSAKSLQASQENRRLKKIDILLHRHKITSPHVQICSKNLTK